MKPPRQAAAFVLAQWLRSGEFPDRLLDARSEDRGLVMEMVYGAVKRRRTLDWALRRCVASRIDPRAEPYLLVGAYQVLFLPDVPDHAAVHETVEAAKGVLTPVAVGFLNAVLRRLLRDREALRRELRSQPLAIRESHPDAMVNRWRKRLGPGRTVRLCRWNNEAAEVVLCRNRNRIEAAAFEAAARSAGIELAPHPHAPDRYWILPRGVPVTSVPGYADGAFSVQDPSMQTPVDLLGLQAGHSVLDACAAPGGKTALIAQVLGPEGTIVAMDSQPDRCERLRENLARLQMPGVRIVTGDASNPVRALGRCEFDRVLLDAPCTNTGVLRRRGDARWRFSIERMSALVAAQRALLDGTAPLVKPGGTLVYAVCSLEPEEGGDGLREWLAAHPEFRMSREVSLIPPDSGTDGLYAARIFRHAEEPGGARRVSRR